MGVQPVRTNRSVFAAGVTRTLRDVQAEILEFVGAETYLVGHSLESDLRALKIVHRRLIDTSELYPSAKGAPFKVNPHLSSYSPASLVPRH